MKVRTPPELDVEDVEGEQPAENHLDDDHPGDDGEQQVGDVDEGERACAAA